MYKHYDVIIVGGRVAGASLAILLGKEGKSVLLLDKAAFPSDTLSTHHMSHLGYLKQLDVLEEVEELGLRKIERMRTYIGDSFVEGPRSSYTVIPQRHQLDHILWKRAEQLDSVTVMENCTFLDVIWEGDRTTGIHTRLKHGEKADFYGKWIVGADGRYSTLARKVNAEEYKKTDPLRPVLYGYYEGIAPLTEPTTEIFLQEGRIGFLFPMEEGRDCLGLEIHEEEFKKMMRSPEDTFETLYKSLYGMEKRMSGARLVGKIAGTKGMPNHFRQASGKGWALTGDAGHSKDPSTGLGINDAFMQSFLLAEAFSHRGSEPAKEMMDAFQKRRDEQLLPGFQLTLDYVRSLRKWSPNEEALFQAMAANPMVWNKLVPRLDTHLKEDTTDLPLLYHSVKEEAKHFGYQD